MNAKLIAKIVSVWAALFMIGLLYGKVNSPDFSEKKDVEDHIEKVSGISVFSYTNQISLGVNKTGSPLKAIMFETDTAITFPAGRYLYVYTAKVDSVKKIINPVYEPGERKKELSTTEWGAILALVGIPAGYNLRDISPIIKSGNPWATALAVAGGVLGLGIGYKMGYDDNFDADTDMAQKVLYDRNFWKGILTKQKVHALYPLQRK